MRLKHVESDRIIFDVSDSIDSYGVMQIKDKDADIIDNLHNSLNLFIKSYGGNKKSGEFIVFLEEELELEEAEKLEETLEKILKTVS